MHQTKLRSAILICASLLPANSSSSSLDAAFASTNGATQAAMSFDYQVEMERFSRPSDSFVRNKIFVQLDHLAGSMARGELIGSPSGDYHVRVTELGKKPDTDGVYVAKYHYEGTVMLTSKPGVRFEVFLPKNPDKIYSASLGKSNLGLATYPCADPKYHDEKDFWYFWHPRKPGCPLQEGRDYDRIAVKLDRRPNTQVTYPEYSRLVDTNGEIRIFVLLGLDSAQQSGNPLSSSDYNAPNYRFIRESLINQNYQVRRWTDTEIKKLFFKPTYSGELPFVEEFTKTVGKYRMVVQMFFGATGLDEKSHPFHAFLKDSFENSGVMIYGGHSGLGGNIDLSAIEVASGIRFQPNPDRYQILFFNSCSSYAYYRRMFFERKARPDDPYGTRNLDIISNGLVTYFNKAGKSDFAVIDSIEKWAANPKQQVSYQELIQRLDEHNSLVNVSGDEDNPTTAQ